ncbi:MAG: type III pantothenate kinase [Alloprevotella sp.]|nr:type III pantothenate kinase [Alloprevotella sp.]
MNLVIDIGNTTGKLAVFEYSRMRHVEAFSPQALHAVREQFAIDRAAFCATGTPNGGLPDWARTELPADTLHVTGETSAPLRNGYSTPQTLGPDRWAAAVGAWKQHPGKPLLIIDAGTCITLDVVTADGIFLGGNISPGLDMRLRAMHEHTARLPLAERQGCVQEIASDTENALRAGAYWGIAGEMKGYYERLSEKYPGLQVILTGGGIMEMGQAMLRVGRKAADNAEADLPNTLEALPAEALAVLGFPFTYAPHLVLTGLDAILSYKQGRP